MNTLEKLSRNFANLGVDPARPEPPRHHRYAIALWLLARHPVLVELVDRLPDTIDGDHYDASEVIKAILDYDTGRHTAAAEAIANMSTTELTRLRMLAFFGDRRVPLTAKDIDLFGDSLDSFITDWTAAVRAL